MSTKVQDWEQTMSELSGRVQATIERSEARHAELVRLISNLSPVHKSVSSPIQDSASSPSIRLPPMHSGHDPPAPGYPPFGAGVPPSTGPSHMTTPNPIPAIGSAAYYLTGPAASYPPLQHHDSRYIQPINPPGFRNFLTHAPPSNTVNPTMFYGYNQLSPAPTVRPPYPWPLQVSSSGAYPPNHLHQVGPNCFDPLPLQFQAQYTRAQQQQPGPFPPSPQLGMQQHFQNSTNATAQSVQAVVPKQIPVIGSGTESVQIPATKVSFLSRPKFTEWYSGRWFCDSEKRRKEKRSTFWKFTFKHRARRKVGVQEKPWLFKYKSEKVKLPYQAPINQKSDAIREQEIGQFEADSMVEKVTQSIFYQDRINFLNPEWIGPIAKNGLAMSRRQVILKVELLDSGTRSSKKMLSSVVSSPTTSLTPPPTPWQPPLHRHGAQKDVFEDFSSGFGFADICDHHSMFKHVLSVKEVVEIYQQWPEVLHRNSAHQVIDKMSLRIHSKKKLLKQLKTWKFKFKVSFCIVPGVRSVFDDKGFREILFGYGENMNVGEWFWRQFCEFQLEDKLSSNGGVVIRSSETRSLELKLRYMSDIPNKDFNGQFCAFRLIGKWSLSNAGVVNTILIVFDGIICYDWHALCISFFSIRHRWRDKSSRTSSAYGEED